MCVYIYHDGNQPNALECLPYVYTCIHMYIHINIYTYTYVFIYACVYICIMMVWGGYDE